jgi:mRNA-degrading endonuclease RelE of RelBE toxin-antitoxin system
MRIIRTFSFKQDYKRLSEKIRKRAENKLRLFLQNPRHPSLQTRKLQSDPTGKTWYGRITRNYRFTFEIEGDTYLLKNIGSHEEIL